MTMPHSDNIINGYAILFVRGSRIIAIRIMP